jgi:hypothetical protein
MSTVNKPTIAQAIPGRRDIGSLVTTWDIARVLHDPPTFARHEKVEP